MKKTKRGTEESVIDYFIVCEELFESVVKMEIDEKRRNTLVDAAAALKARKQSIKPKRKALVSQR